MPLVCDVGKRSMNLSSIKTPCRLKRAVVTADNHQRTPHNKAREMQLQLRGSPSGCAGQAQSRRIPTPHACQICAPHLRHPAYRALRSSCGGGAATRCAARFNSIVRAAIATAPGQAASAPSEAQLQQLYAWSKNKGAALDKVALQGGRLVASKDIAAGEAVLTVPEAAWLNPKAAQQSSIGGLIGEMEPWLQLVLFIMSQRTAPASEWAPYLSCLPSPPATPLFWSAQQQALLQGSQLLESLEGYKCVVLKQEL